MVWQEFWLSPPVGPWGDDCHLQLWSVVSYCLVSRSLLYFTGEREICGNFRVGWVERQCLGPRLHEEDLTLVTIASFHFVWRTRKKKKKHHNGIIWKQQQQKRRRGQRRENGFSAKNFTKFKLTLIWFCVIHPHFYTFDQCFEVLLGLPLSDHIVLIPTVLHRTIKARIQGVPTLQWMFIYCLPTIYPQWKGPGKR